VTLRRSSGQAARRTGGNGGNHGLPFDTSAPEGIVAYIDGGARGNPGPAGYGVRIERPDGGLIDEFAQSIGVATNNVAEYSGLIAALEWAVRHDHRQLLVRSDSLLLVQQMLGNFRVKNAGLQPLHARARVLAHQLGDVTFEHVGRAKNAHADRLANAAMDGAAKA
jgi:ribonuclease HI